MITRTKCAYCLPFQFAQFLTLYYLHIPSIQHNHMLSTHKRAYQYYQIQVQFSAMSNWHNLQKFCRHFQSAHRYRGCKRIAKAHLYVVKSTHSLDIYERNICTPNIQYIYVSNNEYANSWWHKTNTNERFPSELCCVAERNSR